MFNTNKWWIADVRSKKTLILLHIAFVFCFQRNFCVLNGSLVNGNLCALNRFHSRRSACLTAKKATMSASPAATTVDKTADLLSDFFSPSSSTSNSNPPTPQPCNNSSAISKQQDDLLSDLLCSGGTEKPKTPAENAEFSKAKHHILAAFEEQKESDEKKATTDK